MKKYITLTLSLLFCSLLFGQQTVKTKYSVDENSVIRDSSGRQITKIEFYEAVMSGNYQFKPIKDKEGKVIEYLLIRCEKKDNNTKIHFTSSTQCAPTTTLEVGQLAPDFYGKDMSDTVTYDFNYFKGRKIVVLNFWFTKCKPCIEETSDLNHLHERYKDRADIVFVAPTFEFPENIDSFNASHHFEWPILPEAYDAIKSYKVIAYPLNVIIGFDGRIAYVSAGGLPGIEFLLDRKIRDLLGIKDVPGGENRARDHFAEALRKDSVNRARLMNEALVKDSIRKANESTPAAVPLPDSFKPNSPDPSKPANTPAPADSIKAKDALEPKRN